jgi:ABC-type nickel/cobalt efflux system permease component RcnA
MLGILGLGLLLGLRHATDADHIAAVGAMVSERPGWRSALKTGVLWGAGHTASILVAGLCVLGLQLVIPESVARLLEIGVALMVLGLGGSALARALRSRGDVHSHYHAHGSVMHRHLHFHDGREAHPVAWPDRAATHALAPPDLRHARHAARPSAVKPVLVGMMHGLAGSAALMLLVLARIPSPVQGMLTLAVFGLGSIAGMAMMSLGIGLPFAATLSRPGLNRAFRIAAGAAGVAFGLFYFATHLTPA